MIKDKNNQKRPKNQHIKEAKRIKSLQLERNRNKLKPGKLVWVYKHNDLLFKEPGLIVDIDGYSDHNSHKFRKIFVQLTKTGQVVKVRDFEIEPIEGYNISM